MRDDFNAAEITGMFEEPKIGFGADDFLDTLDSESYRDKMLRLAALCSGPGEWRDSAKVDVRVPIPDIFMRSMEMISKILDMDATECASVFIESMVMLALIKMAEHYKCYSTHDARDLLMKEMRERGMAV